MAISGIQPSIGTWRIEWNNGPINRLATADSAISTPSNTPKKMPRARPVLVRARLANRLTNNSPLASSSIKAEPMADNGTKA
ncbi:hypothetical protein D3C86_1679930 [compost metagenome]